MATGGEIDRLQIRELIDRYSDAVIRNDAQAWGDCWAEDACWLLRGAPVTGREAIVATWVKAMAVFSSAWFMAFPGSIDINGDHADVVTHTFEHLVPIDGPPRLQSGIYIDHLVRTAEGWRFAGRSFTPKEIRL